jgi:hypothetical protein
MQTAAIWKYVDGRIGTVRDDLSAQKLHADLRDQGRHAGQTNALLRAIEGIASRIDGLCERIDRIFESRPARRS